MNFNFSRIIKSRLFYFNILVIILLSLVSYFITCFVCFPHKINLKAGSSYNFELKLPGNASITNEDIPVVNINNQKVTENININLNKPFSIESPSEGSMNMELSMFGIPFKRVTLAVLPNTTVIPCGMTVGVRLNTDGVMVLGTGFVEQKGSMSAEPCKGILKSGDLILSANDSPVTTKEDLIKIVEESNTECINIKIKRNEKTMTVDVAPVLSSADGKKKIGAWVRDSTQGIGTVTYYNPQTQSFGALGHGIMDVDTKQIMSVRSGEIMESDIISIKRGKKGNPGELLGDINTGAVLGYITKNTGHGIYGDINLSQAHKLPSAEMEIALQDEVREGPAKIRSNIKGKEIKEYSVIIESVNKYSSDNSKGMVIRITDPELLEDTNGIVQGMSGSPIIQDGKLVGAVTHVFVQDPAKGYGIFIENMM